MRYNVYITHFWSIWSSFPSTLSTWKLKRNRLELYPVLPGTNWLEGSGLLLCWIDVDALVEGGRELHWRLSAALLLKFLCEHVAIFSQDLKYRIKYFKLGIVCWMNTSSIFYLAPYIVFQGILYRKFPTFPSFSFFSWIITEGTNAQGTN